jgi:anion-transporting  ArsA/GET3 family ATPase
MSQTPRTIVCAGGGGVGKTTTSAALALALARQGQRTLVVTVDPARRLASAMGVPVDADVHPAHVEPGVEDHLLALMPEPRRSTRTFIDLLFVDEPEAKARMLENRVYLLLADAAAGMHEVVSLMLVAKAISEHELDYLVIDTAPSRQGLDFISYPGRLATLYEGRAVGWLGNLARPGAEQDDEPEDEGGGGLFAAGRKRIQGMFGKLMNPRTLRDLAGLFAELALVKDRFARLSRLSEHLLLGADTRYLLVAAPSGSAAADATFLSRRLARLGQRPTALVLNRADPGTPAWLGQLDAQAQGLAPELTQALSAVHAEFHARQRSGDLLASMLGRDVPGVPAVRLPTLEVRDPSQIVRQLADMLAEHLPLVAGLRP